jgi:hypothetical protein
MTTFVQFEPSPQEAFKFQATLDGTTYQLVVTWNVFGRRWYLTCSAINGGVVFHLPLIGSPDTASINLVGAYFAASTLVFRASSGLFEITP